MGGLAVISYTPLVRIHLGPLAVSPHGIGAALGLLVGSMLMQRAARQRGSTRRWSAGC